MKKTLVICLLSLGIIWGLGAAAAECRVLLYNVGLLRILFKDFVPDVHKRAKVLARELPAFIENEGIDVFSFQELWLREHRAKFIQNFDPNEFYLVYHAADRVGGIPFGNGLILGVRKKSFEIVPEYFRPFNAFTSRAGGEGLLGRKGFLVVRLRHRTNPSLEFLMVNAHLQNIDLDSAGRVIDPKGQAAQTSQVRQLMDYVWQRSDNGKMGFLLTGDFNSGPGYSERTYNELVGNPALIDPFHALKISADFITWDPKNPLIARGPYAGTPPSRVDHLLFHNGQSTQFEPKRYDIVLSETLPGLTTPGSDHSGVVVHFGLNSTK